jgi:23S rRNA (adenine2503-C2)-methyltransferase
MPVNDRYPIAELLDACRYYCNETNRRISFEWALISGVTDTASTAHELGGLLQGTINTFVNAYISFINVSVFGVVCFSPTRWGIRAGILCHVNLIPLNPTAGFNGTATSREGVADFVRILVLYEYPMFFVYLRHVICYS